MGDWRKNLRDIAPYVPGVQPKQANIIKLNANENPYPPSPKVLEALRCMDGDDFRKYPNSAGNPLRQALAAYHGLAESQVFVGNGSDDVIALCFQAFFNGDAPVLFPDITYSFYPVWAALFGTPFQTVPLTADFHIRPQDYFQANGGVILPNPNAPTGVCQGLDSLREILSHNQDSVVILDEAYVDFGGISALPLLKEFENLVVVQTFSKSRSLAGARIGAAFGNPEIMGVLDAVKNSYNSYPLDAAAIAMGTASLADEAYFQKTVRQIVCTREQTAAALQDLGFLVHPSQANFLFASHPAVSAPVLQAKLQDRGIYVRYFNLPRIENYLRISIGTDAEMQALLQALQAILPEPK